MHANAERVRSALRAGGGTGEIHELDDSARTAVEAASALGVAVGAIVKSLIFTADGAPVLPKTEDARWHDFAAALAGAEPDRATLEEVREAVPAEVPVLLNTGARADTIVDYLQVADGCIVGSSLKVDGYTWNPVDGERARRFVESAREVSVA